MKTLVTDETNAGKALEILADIRNEIITGSAKITDPGYIKEMNGLLIALNKEAEKWLDIQARRYKIWAVKTVGRFYDIYKNEMGQLGSSSDTKDKLYAGMKDYLCQIEPIYLGPAGLKAYTEVFDFFYKELDRDRRLPISSELVNCEKRPLSSF